MDFKLRHWQGEATFFDGQTSRAVATQMKINEHGISVIVDRAEYHYRPKDFRVSERTRDGYLRIDLAPFAGAGITLTSPAALAALQANQFLKTNLVSRLPSKSKLLVLGGGFVLVMVLFFYFGLDLLIHYGLTLVPKSTEEMLGRTALNTLVEKRALVSDSLTLRVLEKCAGLVQSFDTTQTYTITIAIVEDPQTKNAFALPGGYICIYRGILDIMENESELYGLLAHEAGHIYLQHGLRRIARAAIIGFIFTVLLGDASGLSAVLLDNSSVLLQLSYDRKEEQAADDYALAALRRAELNQEGLITLFEKIKKEEKNAQWLTYLSTHPETAERIESLKQKIKPATTSKSILSAEEWAILKAAKALK